MEFTRIEGYKGDFNGVGDPKLELDKDLLLKSVFKNFSEKKTRKIILWAEVVKFPICANTKLVDFYQNKMNIFLNFIQVSSTNLKDILKKL